MLSAVISTIHSYPASTVGTITGTPEVCLFWSSRTKNRSSQYFNAYTGYGPNCLTTFWTQLACRFHGRTAQPLGRTTAPGCDEPTSRCQTSPSIWTLGGDQPVIPGVPFIWWATALPLGIRRITRTYFRICSSYISCSQAHLYPYALRTIANRAECTIALLRYSLGGDRPSQTAHLTLFTALIQGTVLGTNHAESGISHCDSTRPESQASTSPTYATHYMTSLNIRLQ